MIFSPDLLRQQKTFLTSFDVFAKEYFAAQEIRLPAVKVLWDSVTYSYQSGGKRFRPFLTWLVYSLSEKNHIEPQKVYPYALAVEMIHTYSLIHDDLPCMDNDDFRRGKPTNHKVFGEDIALLAGDTLLTLSFSIIANYYQHNPQLAISLIQLLSQQAGPLGMIGGQVLDMKSDHHIQTHDIEFMHNLKTGALIEAAVVGGALIANCNSEQLERYKEYGSLLGLAFQVKDDILDANDKDQDYKSFVNKIGLSETELYLQTISNKALSALKKIERFDINLLEEMISYNLNRQS